MKLLCTLSDEYCIQTLPDRFERWGATCQVGERRFPLLVDVVLLLHREALTQIDSQVVMFALGLERRQNSIEIDLP